MLDILAIILLIAWILGIAASYPFGGYIHGLLALAIILFAVGRIRRRPRV
jgi:hypothetical protein